MPLKRFIDLVNGNRCIGDKERKFLKETINIEKSKK